MPDSTLLELVVTGAIGVAGGYLLKRVEYAREDTARFMTDRRDAYSAYVKEVGDYLIRARDLGDLLVAPSFSEHQDDAQDRRMLAKQFAEDALEPLFRAGPASQALHLLAGKRQRQILIDFEQLIAETSVRVRQTAVTGAEAHVVTDGTLALHTAVARERLNELVNAARNDIRSR